MENRTQLANHKLIFREGEPAAKLYVVNFGEVICLKSAKDRLIPVFLAKKGDIIGESAMVANSKNAYSAITYTSVELLEIPASNFKDILGKSPKWLVDLASTMISRFQNTANLVAENRVIHHSIIREENYPSTLEIEFKKLINSP